MKFEIERKFLLKNDDWKAEAISSDKLTDGLLSNVDGNIVRIRVDGKFGSVTVKGPKLDLTRVEFEYDIPLIDAEFMLATLCGENVCSRKRYCVPHHRHIWFVDVFEELLDGFVTAEIELGQENEKIVLPHWVGQEVTGDPTYGKWATLARHVAMRDA